MALDNRHIVLVGLMGAGKTSVGRQLAAQLKLPFIDTDLEVEYAAGLRISDIFEIYGEDAFRRLEEKVIKRVLKAPGPTVIATGGGAYISDVTQKNIKRYGISIWLKASLEILLERIVTTVHRPILQQGNRAEILKELIDKRYPVYGRADIVIDVDKASASTMAHRLRRRLAEYKETQK